MSNCAIVGINWGDEGKGRIVDLLCSSYDYVVRYQGVMPATDEIYTHIFFPILTIDNPSLRSPTLEADIHIRYNQHT